MLRSALAAWSAPPRLLPPCYAVPALPDDARGEQLDVGAFAAVAQALHGPAPLG
jgi:hypothetical protein